MSPEETFRPGIYRHHKGGRYRAVMLARSSEDRDQILVIYVALTPKVDPLESHRVWVRPLATRGVDSWTDVVRWPDGKDRPRFCFLESGV